MKPLAITAAVVAIGGLLFWILSGENAREQQPQAAPEVAEAEPVAEVPVELALPPELEEEFEIEEVVSEEVVESDFKPVPKGKLTKPKVLGKTRLADGRIEVRIISPVYYGNGEQRNLIRVLRARPRQMSKDAILMRSPAALAGQPVGPGGRPRGGGSKGGEGAEGKGGGLKKKGE